MVRTTQLLHAQREPVATRLAATVLLLRDAPGKDGGLEVLMTRRSMTASFVPGAYVFPGGGVDDADAQADTHLQSTRRPGQSAAALTEAIAAIRESFEELGVLLARRADGSLATQDDIARLDRSQPFAPQCRAQGLTLMGAEVFALARWITDRDMPRRFDVPFLMARMPQGQTPVADQTEQFEPVWISPADALKRHAAGDFFMIFPTIRTLQKLQHYAQVESALQAVCVSEAPLWTSCPRAGLLAGREERFMESDAAFGELALTCPDGQILHALDWQHERPVPLLKNVSRLTAPNPGFMTGPGTNSYIVGDPRTGYIVIDPGPADPEHVQRLWRACGGDIRMIVCTHSHADHSPAAWPLQTLCAENQDATHLVPPILGLPSAPTARSGHEFSPNRSLQNQERLALMEFGLQPDFSQNSGHTLRVIHTPGHAANHLCLVLIEDGLLFSGDHILNGSTTVIDPPDGDMGAYLQSLDVLSAACDAYQVQYILPAHGYVLADAPGAIARLKAHRLAREAKVMQAMQSQPKGTLDDWVALAYADVPERLWPVAKRSLLAHVQRLELIGGANDD